MMIKHSVAQETNEKVPLVKCRTNSNHIFTEFYTNLCLQYSSSRQQLARDDSAELSANTFSKISDYNCDQLCSPPLIR